MSTWWRSPSSLGLLEAWKLSLGRGEAPKPGSLRTILIMSLACRNLGLDEGGGSILEGNQAKKSEPTGKKKIEGVFLAP